MKFTDGNWMMQPGMRPHYPAEAYECESRGGELVVYAPTKPIRHRGDTLDGPLLTVRLSSPMEGVIRVRIEHFTGGGPYDAGFPSFEAAGREGDIAIGDDAATLTSGSLTARVDRRAWRLDFIADGRVVTGSGHRGMGYVEADGGGRYVHEQLALGVGECVYGLGERFTAFVKNGQVVEMWNKDGGAGSEQAYKNVPFYLTNRGYGVFVNHSGPVSFEVASEKVSRVQFSVPGEALEYYVIHGPTPADVLRRYTQLTGRPALPPAWSFGLWLTTSFTTDYDEATVTRFIQGMADRGIPLHVFHFDCFWMREFHWCDFEWDRRTFPDPEGMLRRLKERGLHICVWINPYIAQQSALFEEGRENEYLIQRPDGAVWQTDQWQAGMGIVDFTNPDACRWYADRLRRLVEMGVDCFKTDFGERIPTDVVWYDGSDPSRMHNLYSYLYNRVVSDTLEQARGSGEAVVFARSATAGCQRYPVHWGGDCFSTFESMAESLRGGLSLGLSGFGFWSHDIGGFEGTPPPEVYKRWVAFGLLSSHSRLHGSSSYRVPWTCDEEAVDVLRFFTRLKCHLMPYLYAKAVEAHETGLPVMRAMLLEFPEDPACTHLDRQYLLGDALLVAPVFSEDGVVDYYVPAGRWRHFLTGEVVEGPRWVHETHGFLSLPLLVRPNTLLPVGAVDDRPDYDFAEGVTLRLYELGDGFEASCTVPGLSGGVSLLATARREGSTIRVSVEGETESWALQLAGIAAVRSVAGGTLETGDAGVSIRPDRGSTHITIEL